MKNWTPHTRKVIVTFTVAGIGAVIAEHWLKPQVKRKMHV